MPRQIGVEIEFYGVDVLKTAQLLQGHFGGNKKEISQTEIVVENDDMGDIKVELDSHLAHQISHYMTKNKKSELTQFMGTAGNELLRRASVPVEIVFPPVDEDHLSDVDAIIAHLIKAGAKGTQDNPIFAFGVHLNVSTDETDVEFFHRVLLAFFLLQLWLAEKTRQDVSRMVSGYNKLFPHKFGVELTKRDFQNISDLIVFYKKYIPDRNFALDMYPLWLHLDKTCLDKTKHALVKARPTFHYRLPDCKLGREGWNFSKEYTWWLEVEKLAKDPTRLESIAQSYCTNIKSFRDPFGRDWLNILKTQWGYD